MQRTIRLRFRLYSMILPLVVVAVLLSGVLASLESRAALTRIANRHMAFKAEQLRDFFYSEWEVLTSLDLDGQAEYRTVAQESFRSYALSLLRSETELILAFDPAGKMVMQTGFQDISPGDSVREPGGKPVYLPEGWFSGELLGETRVGVVFELEPLDWTVAVTELHSTFFSDVQNIQYTHIWILIATVVAVTFFLSIFIGHIIRPVECLTETIGRIAETKDLSERARIEFADEIGTLAYKFNAMISTLQESYRQLEATGLAEKRARQTAAEREEETLQILGRVSDFRDEETGDHLRRIRVVAALFSDLLGQSDEQRKQIEHGSSLHDIGKIGIPDFILLKPGKLTAEEFEVLKRHTVLGHELLKDSRSVYLLEGAKIALTHHEKWDGSGYPSGLSGEDIPLSGRIVSIADVFDALTSARPYKEAWSPEEALAYIVEQRGRYFDPFLVDLLRDNFQAFRALGLSREESSDGLGSLPLKAGL